MRTSLDHLPLPKQEEAERIVRIITEEFEDALSLANGDWKLKGKILQIILYGSHARGDWVYEPGTAIGKNSDWDILIVVNDDRLTDYMAFWSTLGKRLRLEFERTHRLLSPVQFIVHSLTEVNDALSHGRYFFIDMVRDGISLYQADNTVFDEPIVKSPRQALKAAQNYYDEWFTASLEFFDDYQSNVDRGRLKKAAFELHQSVERLYQTVLLVCTLYTPYVHDLVKLRGQAEQVAPSLRDAWPREQAEQVDAFEVLQQAYVKARYTKDFHVSSERLEWLGNQTAVLIELVRAVCEARLLALKADIP